VVRYREIPPSARLQAIVDSFWILEHDGEDAAPQRVVPDGHPELILNWSQPFEAFQNGRWEVQPRCFLAGQIDGPLLLRPHGPARILGVRFHPDGAARVLAAPMHELSGRFTAVEDLAPTLARDLNYALESREAIARVEAALCSAANSVRAEDMVVNEAVRRITHTRGAADLAQLARELGVGTRQLERRFRATVGLPPKLFGRLQRFNNVFRALAEPQRNWVDAAVACGYYDQAHLIRDCKSFSGNTPTALLAEDADLARHFLLRFGMSHSSNTARRVLV